MKSIRWYDKNPLISEVFEFIEKLEAPIQNEMANDIIQILMNEINLNLDKELNDVNKDYIYECKRWYDKNPNLHTAFEIIKKLSDRYQTEVMKKIIETALLMSYEQRNKGKL